MHLHDPEAGLAAEVTYRSPDGIPVLRSEVILRNEGQTTLHLESVSSLTVGCLTPQDPAAVDAADLLWADNDWLAECRWQRQPMRRTTPDPSGRVKYGHGKAGFELTGQGTWSSCGHLPMGGLTDRHTGRTWMWQIEHNGGGWRWECQEHDHAAYAALFGPTDTHHGWRHALEPGAAFRTVPVALSFSADGGPDAAFAALTRYRRAHRRPHADHRRLPVIFNDYMNCLMGDPTTDKLLPLIDAAAEAGAEYFVIDAGWYDDSDGWWTSVGAWEPSASRFPGEKGIHKVLDRIRERGMVPGLWLEPEVIGVDSPMAKSLPAEAFFRRDGVRLTETGVSIARGRTPNGPFEPCPANPILTHRGTDHPVQNTGHADLVQAPDGSWCMVFLGVRPHGSTPGWHVLGRETFLTPVTWEDDWPVVGEVTTDLSTLPWPLSPAPVEEGREDFELGALGPTWISVRDRPTELCTTKERPGWLTLRARGGSLDEPDAVFTGRRQQHLTCRARTLVDPEQGRGGLAVRLDERHHYAIEASGTDVRVIVRVGSLRTVVAERSVPAGPLVLVVTITDPPPPHGPCTGPDTVSLGVEKSDGTFTELATLDGRYLSTEVAGGFTGRVIGMYAAEGTVHFDWFDYEPLDR